MEIKCREMCRNEKNESTHINTVNQASKRRNLINVERFYRIFLKELQVRVKWAVVRIFLSISNRVRAPLLLSFEPISLADILALNNSKNTMNQG